MNSNTKGKYLLITNHGMQRAPSHQTIHDYMANWPMSALTHYAKYFLRCVNSQLSLSIVHCLDGTLIKIILIPLWSHDRVTIL